MSTVLTENIVLSRTRQHDLSRVRKLNCWGSELSDVSIVERMPHVEVLSLTINNITTLRDFGACKNLQELYLRKNKIADINELYYIQELPNLKKLTLNENPCAEHPNYRYTVLRALPYLELLDNVPVTSEEVYKAQTLGNEISDPTIEAPLRPHPMNGNQQHHVQQNNQLSTESTQLTTQNHEEEDYSYEVYEEEAAEINQEENVQYREHSRNDLDKQSLHGTAPVTSQVSSAASSEASQSPRLKHKQANQSQRHSLPVSSSSPTDTNHDEWKENNTKQATTPVNSSSSSSSSMPSILIPSRRYGFQSIQQLASNQHKALSKGGKNRNANILSAVLCLIKELDYASLEVAETHIHCRMEEMEEQG